MTSELLLFFIGIVPIAWLFFALCILRLPGHVACPCGLLIAAALAFFVLLMPPLNLVTAAFEGLIFALWPILLVIVAAMILYKYSVETGGMETIKRLLTGISHDKRILVLILAWGFGSFLEGVAGFGVPVLIPGAILVSLGFSPMFSIVACLVANSVPTPFATLGIPVTTLAGVTDLSAGVLGFGTALQLIIPCIILPFFLVMLAGGGLRAVKGVGLITLIAGLSLAAPILLVTRFLGPELPALLGSFCTIGCIALANKHLYKDTAHNRQFHIDVSPSAYISTAASISDISAAKANALPAAGSDKPLMSVPQACLPFAIVLVIMLITRLIGPVYRTLSNVKADMIAYSGPGAYVLSFTFLLTPGLLILISVFLASVMQGYRISALWHIIKSSLIESKNMAITIVSIVAMAKIMVYSGMTGAIALMLIAAFSVFYPLVAPVIGLFGVFITGSNTSCAILFGHLQASAARAIGASPPWIVSSNMSGAALGKMISPQSIAIGLRIGGLDGEEGAIIRQTLKYSLFCVVIVCVITYIFV